MFDWDIMNGVRKTNLALTNNIKTLKGNIWNFYDKSMLIWII